jgi:hypothetical protein
MSTAYASYDAFFDAVKDFADRLNVDGHTMAADKVRYGFSCIYGLTDGWAQLGESLEEVRASESSNLTAELRAELDEIAAFVWGIVHR